MVKVNKQPEIHNEELEEEIKLFADDQSNERMVRIMKALSGALIVQPAIFPVGTDPAELKKVADGGMSDSDLRPQPVVLKNKEGENFFPIFTSQAQIPAEQNYPAMLFLPFMECVKLASRLELNLTGIVVNPFSNNMIIHQAALDMLKSTVNSQQITLTGEQMHVFLRNQIEMMELPKKFFQDQAAFLDQLQNEKGSFMENIYQDAYSKVKGLENMNPYKADSFETISLNISDTERLTQITMPEQGRNAGQCMSVILVLNPERGDCIYYTIKQGNPEEANKLGFVAENGIYTELGEAPQEGSELYSILNILPWKKNS